MTKPKRSHAADEKPRKERSTRGEPRATKPRGLASASQAMGEAAIVESAPLAIAVPPAKPPKQAAKPKAKKPKTREGKKGLVLYVEPEWVLALRRLALDLDSDVQRMGRRALELLFAEHGRALPEATARRAANS